MIIRMATRIVQRARSLFSWAVRPVPGEVRLVSSEPGSVAEPRLAVQGSRFRRRLPRTALARMERALRGRLAAALIPDGSGEWTLRWEELDLEKGIVRQREAAVGVRIPCLLSLEKGAVRLHPAGDDGWVSAIGSDDSESVLTRTGWETHVPRLDWRYVSAGAAARVRMRWSAVGLPELWKQRIGEKWPVLRCVIAGAGEARLVYTPATVLEYEGTFTTDSNAELVERRSFEIEQALQLQLRDGSLSGTTFNEPASFDVRDIHADTRSGWSRYVADTDTELPVTLAVFVPEGALLPEFLTCGRNVDGTSVLRARRLGGRLPPPAFARDIEPPPTTPVGTEAWLLQSDQTWDSLFSGAREWQVPSGSGTVAAHACVWRVPDRRTRRAFVVTQAENELLAQISEEWMVPGAGGGTTLGREAKVDRFGPRVPLVENGLQEWFDRDSGSGLPQIRLLLGPDSWSVYAGGEVVSAASVYGDVGGGVRWRLKSDERRLPRAADWASAGVPVLVTRPGDPLCWGGLHVPEPVPWTILRPIQPQSHSPVIRIPATPGVLGLWIDLGGHVAGYERAGAVLVSATGAETHVVLWVARTPLPLFPKADATLLRSFAPLHVVRDSAEPFLLHYSANPDSPRPTLRMGSALVDGNRPSAMKLGGGTHIASAWSSQQPPARFAGDAIPGMHSSLEGEGHTLWLALEVPHGAVASAGRSGYLLRWDAENGWSLGGFFAAPGAPIWLGASAVDGHAIVLEEAEPRASEFRLVLERGAEPRWEGAPLPELPSADALRDWIEGQRMEFQLRPEPLQGYTPELIRERHPRVVAFRREFSVPAERLPIRVWELSPEAVLPARPNAGGLRTSAAESPIDAARSHSVGMPPRTIRVSEPELNGVAAPVPGEAQVEQRTIGTSTLESSPDGAYRSRGVVTPQTEPVPGNPVSSQEAGMTPDPLPRARAMGAGPRVIGAPMPVSATDSDARGAEGEPSDARQPEQAPHTVERPPPPAAPDGGAAP